MSDDESSQEPVEGIGGGGGVPGGEMGGGDNGDDGDGSDKASGSGAVSMQMLQAYARKRAKLSSKSSKSGSGGSRIKSSASRTRPVVKLMVTSVSRSYNEPWRRRQQRESSGTGFLIRWHCDDDDSSSPADDDTAANNAAADSNNNAADTATDNAKTNGDSSNASKRKSNINSIRIVTNAHVVRNASTVRARASFGPHVVSCDVEWLSVPLDLALLKISEGDWEDFCRGWSIGDLLNDDGIGNGGAAADAAVENSKGKSDVKGGEDGKEESVANAAPATETSADGAAKSSNKDNNSKPTRRNSNSKSSNNNSICLTLSTSLPSLDSNVTCVGFPTGGTQISVTRGVVSRIDVNSHYVLRIQIDAAINPGNSGGPVFDERGHVVGIASAHLRGAGNIGYIIPSKIVSMFLEMCGDGMEVKVEDRFSGLGSLVVQDDFTEDGKKEPRHVPGIPNLSIHGSQTLESKALRRHLGLEELDLSGGVRIVGSVGDGRGTAGSTSTAATSKEENDDNDDNGNSNDKTDESEDCLKKLKGDDVLLAINGIPIGMDGTIQLSPTRPDERINFRSLVTCQRVGSKVTLDVLRKKQRRELEVELDMSRFLVSQYDDFDAVPLYVVVGGCVFSPLTLPLMQEKKSKSPSGFNRFYNDQRSGHEQVLILSKVLNDDVNVGYHGWKNLVLKSVNGYEPTNIQDLVAVLVRKMHSEMVEFRCQFVGQDDADYVICMNLKEVLQSEHRVMKQHMIASWCSMDALSRELREEVEKYEPSEAKRMVSWNTMKDMRAILERKEEK